MKNNAIFIKGLIIGFLWALMPAQGFAMEQASKSDPKIIRNAVIAWLQQDGLVSADNRVQDIQNIFAQESALMEARVKAFNELSYNGIQLEYEKILIPGSQNFYYLLNYKVNNTTHYFIHINLLFCKQIYLDIWLRNGKQKSGLLDSFVNSYDSAKVQAEHLMQILQNLNEETLLCDYFYDFFKKTTWASLEEFCNFIAIVNQIQLCQRNEDLFNCFAFFIAQKFVAEYEQVGSLSAENTKLMLNVIHKCVSNMTKEQWGNAKLELEKDFDSCLNNSFKNSPFVQIIDSVNNQLKFNLFNLPDEEVRCLQSNEEQKLISYFVQTIATNTARCFCKANINDSLVLQQLLEEHAEFSDRDLIEAFQTVSNDAEKINVQSKEDSPFVFFEYISKDNKKSYFISIIRENCNWLSQKLQIFESQNDFISSDHFRIVIKLPATSLKCAKIQVDLINRLFELRYKKWDEDKQLSFLYDIYDEPLENLFESCVFLDYCGFKVAEKNIRGVFPKLLAIKLVDNYYDNTPISNAVLTLIRGYFGNLFTVAELKNELMMVFYYKECGSFLDERDLFKEIFNKSILKNPTLSVERSFNESPFACIPEFYTEVQIPQKLPGRVASIMGKVGQLLYGSKKNEEAIDQDETKSTEKVFNTPNSYEGLELANLKCMNLFGQLFTARAAVSNSSLYQTNYRAKCSLIKMLGLYPRVQGSLNL